MNKIEVIKKCAFLMSRVGDDIKKSPYKTKFFMDKLGLKSSFFYKKMRNNSFTIGELKIMAPYIYEKDQKKYEKEVIKNLLSKSRQEMRGGETEEFAELLKEAKNLYGV